ncbi:hypothetical protein CRG98_012048 [Punica granatum]|uniref:Uncharacterized protein n=1 Tax=Punica granatum TaxID=22663 RepID=A0A2I0KG32_PUNGR|nr:hypothetical protein CRG98_012048 [Punica granatum]
MEAQYNAGFGAIRAVLPKDGIPQFKGINSLKSGRDLWGLCRRPSRASYPYSEPLSNLCFLIPVGLYSAKYSIQTRRVFRRKPKQKLRRHGAQRAEDQVRPNRRTTRGARPHSLLGSHALDVYGPFDPVIDGSGALDPVQDASHGLGPEPQ